MSNLAVYPQDCSNCLTGQDLNNFLAGNMVANQAVQNLIETGYWPNGQPGPQGYSIYDPTYGNVLMAVDANGMVYYLASNLPAAQPGVVNSPTYTSPTNVPSGPTVCPGWSNIGSLNDFLACLGKGLTTLETVAFLAIGYLIYREMK